MALVYPSKAVLLPFDPNQSGQCVFQCEDVKLEGPCLRSVLMNVPASVLIQTTVQCAEPETL